MCPPSVGNFKFTDMDDTLEEVPVESSDSWEDIVVKRVDWHSGRDGTSTSPDGLPPNYLSDNDRSISPISLAFQIADGVENDKDLNSSVAELTPSNSYCKYVTELSTYMTLSDSGKYSYINHLSHVCLRLR